MKKTALLVVGILIIIGILSGFNYFMLISFNLGNIWFPLLLTVILLIISISFKFMSEDNSYFQNKNHRNTKETIINNVIVVLVVLFIIVLITGLSGWKIFNAPRYQQQVSFEEKGFTEFFNEEKEINIPLIDKDTSIKIATRKIGEQLGVESTNYVIDENSFTQIMVEGVQYRIATLKFEDFWKRNNNNGEIPYYILINMETEEVIIKDLREEFGKGMVYSNEQYFSRNLKRHLYFNGYATSLLGDDFFEIDDNGKPYWITLEMKNTINLFNGVDVKNIIVTDPFTGEIVSYKRGEQPSWIDTTKPTDLVIEQSNNHFELQKGFWNSKFGQEGLSRLDRGIYNYINVEGEIFIYTGLKPMSSSQNSTIGLVFMSKTTDKNIVINMGGASLESAMESSTGSIAEKQFTPTVPIVQNINGEPVYVLSLKDNNGLVRMYAYISYKNYQKIGLGYTLEEALSNFKLNNNSSEGEQTSEVVEKRKVTGVVKNITTIVQEGNSFLVIQLETEEELYILKASSYQKLLFVNKGEEITFEI